MKQKLLNFFLIILSLLLIVITTSRIIFINQFTTAFILDILRNYLFVFILFGFIKYTWKSLFLSLVTSSIILCISTIEILLRIKHGETFIQLKVLLIFLISICVLIYYFFIKFFKEFCIEENAQALVAKNKIKSAILVYSVLIRKNRNRTDLIYSRGTLFDKINKYKKAKKDFLKSIESENPDPRGFIALGIYKYENHENDKAIELLRKGVQLNPDLYEYLPQPMKDIIKL